MIAIYIGVFIWMLLLTFLLTPSNFYANTWDRITKARYRQDRINLQIMLDHLRSFPDDWSISRDSAHFPKTGAKSVYLNKERDKWQYSLSSFDSRSRELDSTLR